MKRLVLLFVCVLSFVFVFIGCTNNVSTPNNVIATISNDIQTYTIETDYCDLKYPVEWKEKVKTNIESKDNEYIVHFLSDDTDLFDLLFNCGSGDVLGTLLLDGENVVIRVSFAELNPKVPSYDDYVKMQAGVEVILSNLSSDYDFIAGEEYSYDKDSVYEIKTDVVSLYYPLQWKDIVTVKQSDDVVSFVCDDIKLFDIFFNEAVDGASLMGTYDGTDIFLLTYDIEQDQLSDYSYNSLCAMQESVDVILDNLNNDSKFVSA